MGSIRTCVMLFVLALTLGLATSAAAQPLSGPEFIALSPPCRALDTRVTGTPLQANVLRTIQIGGRWRAHHGGRRHTRFTVTQPQAPGHMAAWPSGPLPRRRR